jgi:Tol biopolymer transport system component
VVPIIGTTLGHYQVVERIGAGGMGVVYKARDLHLDRFVALKILPPEKVADPERKLRFVQEAKAASALSHPNIITIYDIDQADGVDYIAMEYVAGKTLDNLIPRKGMRFSLALEYAVQIADALARAHGAGIIHRDLKPSNVMVDEHGLVKILDFGLAKLMEDSGPEAETVTTGTAAGAIVGTASYMSPEQAEGKPADARSDIFSFGAVLYEMITGRRAFAGASVVSVLSAVLRDEPKPAAEIAHGLPRELDRIVRRCLQKAPNRRYQHTGDLKIDLEQVRDDLAAGRTVPGAKGRRQGVRRWWYLGAATALMMTAFAVGWWLHVPAADSRVWKLTRLTADAGLSNTPALSPDGKLLAFSSDRGREGEQDLYVRQIGEGQPIRLTTDGAGNTAPDFSPDGTRLIFGSNRDNAGIYEIPAFGGDVRLLARDGLGPKFSPDGSQVAYWIGTSTVASAVPGSGMIWVVPSAGGPPQRVGPSFTTARHPIWSPDGKHLLFIGYASAKAYDSASIDWWLASPGGSEVIRTGAHDAMVAAGLLTNGSAYVPVPACWMPADNMVVFSLASGEAENLWEIGISPRTGKTTGTIRRVTISASSATSPTCTASGSIAFANVETSRDVWWLPVDLDRGTPRGALQRMTQSPAFRYYLSLSSNGRYAAFASDQSGQSNIWIRDVTTGKESHVASSALVQRFPAINASGTRVAYSVYEKDKRAVYVSAPGGAPEKLCDGCLRATSWARDENTVLIFGGDPYQISVLDLASHRQTPILKHPLYSLLFGVLSPDGRWVSFTVRTGPNRARIAIAPMEGPKPIPESSWITIAEVGLEDWANWSPDGNTLYFTSPRDGHRCLWGQRIERTSHRPVHEPFAVLHLHGRLSYTNGGWSVAAERIGLVLNEDTGNIWMMSRAGPP